MNDRPPVWRMVKEAIDDLGGVATYGQIRDFIKEKFGPVNVSTITCHIILCSVNHPTRIHYTQKKSPEPVKRNMISCSTSAEGK